MTSAPAWNERAVWYSVRGSDVLAVLHQGESGRKIGMVIVVGGPQYRVGSHRQFLLLARQLSNAGFPVMRFDCRGMGDSGGEFAGFEWRDAEQGFKAG